MLAATLLTVSLAQASATGAAIDPQTGLRVGPGWQTVAAHCSVCHSLRLVTAQRADRETWHEMIRWMQQTQNLWQFDPETEDLILDYLSGHYPPARIDRRRPLPDSLRPPPQR